MNPWLDLQSNEVARTFPGNICTIRAVPVEYIDVFPDIDPVTQTMQNDIVLIPGKMWLTIKLQTKGSAINESSSFEASGILWKQTISGVLFGHSISNHLQANNWSYHQWVLIVNEVGSNISYLIGNRYRGAQLTVSYNNQDTTITNIQFDFASASRAIIYQAN